MASAIIQTHEKLVKKEISCTQLVKEKLEALAKNQYNSVNFLLSDLALAKAKQVDDKIAKGEKIGLLEGIPFGVKDVFLLQGQHASASSKFLKNYISPYTATAIQKLVDAGAIPVCKENADSFGHGSTSENTIFGSVKNAHNEELVGGGSSGGSAVNVAKEYTVFSIGGDTGGSIRQPAGYNKVYGFKPTYGRISRYGLMAYASSTDCVGPITSSLEDIELVMNVISGKDYHDQTTYESQAINLAPALTPESVTVGYYGDFIDNKGLDEKIKSDFLAVIEKIKAKGIQVKALSFKNADTLVSTYYALAMAETASNLARLDGSMYGERIAADTLKESYAVTRSEGFTAESQRRIVGGNQVLSQGYADEIYLKAQALRKNIIQLFTQDFKEVSVILSPVSPTLPPKIGNSLKDPLAMYLSDIYTIGFSLGELPTLTTPLGTATGIQITADKKQDELTLKFAKYLNEIL